MTSREPQHHGDNPAGEPPRAADDRPGRRRRNRDWAGPERTPDTPYAAEVRSLAGTRRDEPGALLPILHDVCREYGWIDPAAIPVIAEELNLTRAEVYGVVSFYRDFRTEAPGGTTVRICRGEACQANGCHSLIDHATDLLGVKIGATTPDGALTLDEVFCLGNCALGPSVQVGEAVHGRVDVAALDALLDQAQHTAQAPGATQPHTEQLTTITVYVPQDIAAVAVGADELAGAAAAAATVVRTGSRGLLWLEPLLEVATAAGRVGYGPLSAKELPGVLATPGLADGPTDHPRCIGLVEELPWLARQHRLTFARVGVIDPLSLEDYADHGGLVGLRRALTMSSAEVVAEVTASGLRGRGGAGFPTGIKWRTVLDTSGVDDPGSPVPCEQKYICCNADEGDSGTFADRMMLEGDPFSTIEGMVIAGYAVRADKGYVYLRSEYPAAARTLRTAIDIAYAHGLLGNSVLGSGFAFELELRMGAGAYICGEETSMLDSLEGKRGMIRPKPPIPALRGLFGRPTVINNLVSLASVPMILADGAAAYAALGTGRSLGTSLFQLAGNIARGGIVEVPFGVTLRELVEDFGGGTRSGRPIRAVQVGGPLGAYLPASQLDTPMDYESLTAVQAMLGHGGIVVFDDTVNMAEQARFAMEFCAEESCGKCTPCRIGSVRGVEVIDRIRAGQDRDANLVLLEDLCEVMTEGSLCALGGLTPMPVRSALRHFPEDFSSQDFLDGSATRTEVQSR
ncbi:MAG: NAD(P)H-dependent oxidoreductase subunit E [Candidatus Nanopelagicales bacterium]